MSCACEPPSQLLESAKYVLLREPQLHSLAGTVSDMNFAEDPRISVYERQDCILVSPNGSPYSLAVKAGLTRLVTAVQPGVG